MTNPSPANEEQSTRWNSRVGETWVAQQRMLDRLFLPFERVLADAVLASGARNVLDIGCGAGATSIAVARALGSSGQCTGLDISLPLVEAARRKAEAAGVANAHFIRADAQTHAFAPASHDAVISRFGVMFFDDPLAAFANLRRAARSGAALSCIAWRSPRDNPFMIAAEKAAAPLLPQLPPVEPGAPGQFAFVDPDRVSAILSGSWQGVKIEPLDVECELSEADLRTYATSMGRVGTMLADLDAETREAVTTAVTRAFDPYLSNGFARFTAACSIITARAD